MRRDRGLHVAAAGCRGTFLPGSADLLRLGAKYGAVKKGFVRFGV